MRPVFASEEYLAHRADAVRRSHDLTGLAERLARLARPLLERPIYFPEAKAQLSQDGGICPVDGGPLAFDPWSPDEHTCPRCGGVFSGERHHEQWLMWYHLWLTERALHLAILGGLRADHEAVNRGAAIIGQYAEHYHHFPNRDCVLGPSRLFFSTYLESVWLTIFVGASDVLRALGALSAQQAIATAHAVKASAELIAEFDEGLSNRQTWHHTALLAAGTYLGDDDLAARALDGVFSHLTRGIGADGMWHEGENYHFFAQRALLLSAMMATAHGLDLFHGPRVAERLPATFDAVLATLQPDLTFPARRNAQYGASLRQPRFAEAWEMGVPHVRSPRHTSFLRYLYGAGYGHDDDSSETLIIPDYQEHGGEDVSEIEYHWPAGRFGRDRLSWKALLWMRPELPEAEPGAWRLGSHLLAGQGIAVLRRRRDRCYVSVEFGHPGSGHGHPDRLHLSVHARGRAWLTDFGTGSYVTPDLFWYRSTLAHNAPLVDGVSQTPAEGVCTAFGEMGEWAWCRGELPWGTATAGSQLARTVFQARDYILDFVEFEADHEAWLLVPWHFLTPPGDEDWEPVETPPAFGASPFVHDVRQCPTPGSPIHASDGSWTLSFAGDGFFEVYSAAAPGPPYAGDLRFLAVAGRGSTVQVAAALAVGKWPPVEVARVRDGWEAARPDGMRHRFVTNPGGGWVIHAGESSIVVEAMRRGSGRAIPWSEPVEEVPSRTIAVGRTAPEEPSATFDGPDSYRRAESPYPGADRFSARARLWWSPEAVHLALEVVKPDLVPRAADAPDPRLDNESPDIHADGIQLYVRWPGGPPRGYVLVPDPDRPELRPRPVAGTAAGTDEVHATWSRTAEGYRIDAECRAPQTLAAGMEVEFDCLVNEMWPNRRRRAGQLVLSGGGGWVWLAGDRQAPERFARLALS